MPARAVRPTPHLLFLFRSAHLPFATSAAPYLACRVALCPSFHYRRCCSPAASTARARVRRRAASNSAGARTPVALHFASAPRNLPYLPHPPRCQPGPMAPVQFHAMAPQALARRRAAPLPALHSISLTRAFISGLFCALGAAKRYRSWQTVRTLQR